MAVMDAGIWVAMGTALLASLWCAAAATEEAATTTFYVATNGRDDWSGRLSQPNAQASDGPFATLARARDALRELKRTATGLPSSVTVLVRAGKYFLDETLLLDVGDSGTQDCPVTYAAYPDEHPVLSGGIRVGAWRPFKGNVMQAKLPRSTAGQWRFRQLFFDGERQRRSRWPKFEPDNPLYGGWAIHEGGIEHNQSGAFKCPAGFFQKRWANPTMGEVNIFIGYGWLNEIIPIASVDRRRRIITLARRIKDFDSKPWYMPVPLVAGNRFYVENLLEEVDEPGAWCLDRERGIVCLWPPQGDIAQHEVVVPQLDCLIDLRGVSWVTITGLTFTETADGDNYHRDGVDGVGSMLNIGGLSYCGDAVHLRDCHHCRIEGNLFRAVGGNAIYLEGYNAHNLIARNEIAHAGANAICLAGSREKQPLFNRVEDNHVHHCGAINKYVAGVFLGTSDGNYISHNRIEYVPHHAVNLADNPHGRNVVECNEIRWSCQEVADNAAINCWMELPPREGERCGHIIRYNLIADTYGCEVIDGKIGRSRYFPTSGIYLDNYASNCFVHGNLILRASAVGVLVHAGKNNVIENNVFVDCRTNVRLQDVVSTLPYWHHMGGFMTGNHIARNIGYQTGPDAFLFHLDAWTDRVLARCDDNVFFQIGGEYRVEHSCSLTNGVRKSVRELHEGDRVETLAAWLRLGYDAHSIFADPLFVDTTRDDYRLKPESPALGLGFQPLPVDEIGPRQPSGL
jgi:parallel beta-helix repeat protein